jgi:hypothetical protein
MFGGSGVVFVCCVFVRMSDQVAQDSLMSELALIYMSSTNITTTTCTQRSPRRNSNDVGNISTARPGGFIPSRFRESGQSEIVAAANEQARPGVQVIRRKLARAVVCHLRQRHLCGMQKVETDRVGQTPAQDAEKSARFTLKFGASLSIHLVCPLRHLLRGLTLPVLLALEC